MARASSTWRQVFHHTNIRCYQVSSTVNNNNYWASFTTLPEWHRASRGPSAKKRLTVVFWPTMFDYDRSEFTWRINMTQRQCCYFHFTTASPCTCVTGRHPDCLKCDIRLARIAMWFWQFHHTSPLSVCLHYKPHYHLCHIHTGGIIFRPVFVCLFASLFVINNEGLTVASIARDV